MIGKLIVRRQKPKANRVGSRAGTVPRLGGESEAETRAVTISLGSGTACLHWLLPRTLALLSFIILVTIFLNGCLPEEQKQLSAGEKLYRAKCTSCHRLLPIEDYPLEKFEEYIEKYGKELTLEEKSMLLELIKKLKS